MSKLFLFYLLFRLTGNPLIAIVVILVVLYFADRRFIGLLPSITRPFKNSMRSSELKATLQANPHNTSAKMELGRLLLAKGQYEPARRYLEEAIRVVDDSPVLRCDLGLAYLGLKQTDRGVALIQEALAVNPRIDFGEPYLTLAETVSPQNKALALEYLLTFKSFTSSSVKAYYRLGRLYEQLGQQSEAKSAYAEALDIYRSLPGYIKKTERKWALLCWFKAFS